MKLNVSVGAVLYVLASRALGVCAETIGQYDRPSERDVRRIEGALTPSRLERARRLLEGIWQQLHELRKAHHERQTQE